jgi:hypothetical protein
MTTSQSRLGLYLAANALELLVMMASATGQGSSLDLSRCLSIADAAARLHCFEATVGDPLQTRSSPGEMGTWRLVRATDPRGGPDAVSIMHTADVLRSDGDIAGLTLRCADNSIEVLVIVIEPRPPRARPRVTLSSGGNQASYEATVVGPFTALLLPQEATAMLSGLAQSGAPELSVGVSDDATGIQGIVKLAGLRPALDGLRGICPRP